eukprot:1158394-Pelagomonas_calceolata.AAC.2
MQGGHREDFAWHAKALALLRWTRWACCKDLQEIRKQKISMFVCKLSMFHCNHCSSALKWQLTLSV